MKISQIAEKAGVSIGTVDRVLHNRGRVSPITKQKIEAIIKESNYKPNVIASNLKNGKSLKIGLLIPLLSSEGAYWKDIKIGMDKAIIELEPFSVTLITEEFDRTIKGDSLRAGKKLLEQKVDIIALPPVVQSESYSLISLMDKIPYAFFDSSLPGAKPLSECLQLPYKAGFNAGRMMELFHPTKGKYLCIQMHSTVYNLQQRAEGFTDYFKDKDSEVINALWNFSSSKEMFKSFIDSLMNENPKIDGIFITNDSVSRLVTHLEEMKIDPLPVIIGMDLTRSNCKNLLDDKIKVLLSQEPSIQGYNTIMEIFRVLLLKIDNGIKSDPIPINIVIKENLEDKYK